MSAFARRLARYAVFAPLLVLLAIFAHGLWLQRDAGPLAQQRRLFRRLGFGQLCLTPAGLPPREGPGSHPAIDRRQVPQQARETLR